MGATGPRSVPPRRRVLKASKEDQGPRLYRRSLRDLVCRRKLRRAPSAVRKRQSRPSRSPRPRKQGASQQRTRLGYRHLGVRAASFWGGQDLEQPKRKRRLMAFQSWREGGANSFDSRHSSIHITFCRTLPLHSQSFPAWTELGLALCRRRCGQQLAPRERRRSRRISSPAAATSSATVQQATMAPPSTPAAAPIAVPNPLFACWSTLSSCRLFISTDDAAEIPQPTRSTALTAMRCRASFQRGPRSSVARAAPSPCESAETLRPATKSQRFVSLLTLSAPSAISYCSPQHQTSKRASSRATGS